MLLSRSSRGVRVSLSPNPAYILHCSSFLGLPFGILVFIIIIIITIVIISIISVINIKLVQPKKGTTKETIGKPQNPWIPQPRRSSTRRSKKRPGIYGRSRRLLLGFLALGG